MPPPSASPPLLQPADLGAISLFASLDLEQHRRLLENHRLQAVAAEHCLVMEEEESQGLFLLRSGLIKVRCFDLDGEETVLGLLGPGDVCGEMAVLNPQGLRSADLVTLTACNVAILRAGPFSTLLRSEGRLALALAQLQCQRLQAVNRRLRLRGGDASTRLLAALVDLASHCAPDALAPAAAATVPIPPLPQRELAGLAGLAREPASRTLGTLRRRALVADTPDGGLQLLDPADLQRRGLLG
jgi:CRP/FNR family cyclic AMP-dependent transcriptional regulator